MRYDETKSEPELESEPESEKDTARRYQSLGPKKVKGCVCAADSEKGVLDVIVKKGDLFFADLSPVVGSEQGGVRPVLVVQNDVGNKYSPTIIVAAVTSQTGKAKLPTHVELQATQGGLSKNSVVLLEQLRTIDKQRLKERIGSLNDAQIPVVDEALGVSLGIANLFENH